MVHPKNTAAEVKINALNLLGKRFIISVPWFIRWPTLRRTRNMVTGLASFQQPFSTFVPIFNSIKN
jgi:hypothetical protein